MRCRRLGRLGWQVSEIGYGMWGISGGPGGFTGWDHGTAPDCLDLAVDPGCADERWQQAVAQLKAEGLIEGLIFDQAPQDELFERTARDDIGIIARVPFDEGGLTGTLTADTTFPADDRRAVYFGPENLGPTVRRAERLARVVRASLGVSDGQTIATELPADLRAHRWDREPAWWSM